MSRFRFPTTFLAAVVVIALLGACSAESLAEFATERYVESQTDGEVDIDFGNGGFSVSTEEGDFALNLDGENGALVFDSDEGSGVVNFDAEDGTITYDTDEGSGVVTFDVDENSETGSITFDSDQGSGAVNIDADDGTITYDTDEGAGTINFGASEAPDGWPSFIGAPTTTSDTPAVYTSLNDGSAATMSGTFTHDVNEDFAGAVVARVEQAGFVTDYTQSGDGSLFAQFSNVTTKVLVMTDGRGATTVTVTAG